MSPATDVFVSYKAEDRARLAPLVNALEVDGFTVWWDAQISGGSNWQKDIEEHLDAARCVLVAWTRRSVGDDGHFVRDEARRAQRRGTYVPIRLDAVEPPLGFGEIQVLSLKGWKGDRADPRYLAVADAVRSRISGTASNHGSSHMAPPQVSRRAAMVGGGLAVVAIAGLGAWELVRPSAASASKSIAVLPFVNLSGDPSQAYFSDGVAEEIRSSLTRLGGLTVIGSSSSEAVRNDDAKTAAQKLGVANILTGSVRESPSTIRITAELIDGRTGADRWSQDYDRQPGDTIKIQTDIAENVASALKGALGLAARAALSVGGTQNPEAQKLLLQTRNVDSFSKQGLDHALDLIDQAIALDPNYADAYARKAQLLVLMGERFPSGTADAQAMLDQAEQFANRALQLAPTLPVAHLARAGAHASRLQVAAAKDEYDRALAIAPDDPVVLNNYAAFLAQIGDSQTALRLANKLGVLEPLTPRAHVIRTFVLYTNRRYSDAYAEEQLIERRWPNSVIPLLFGETLMLLNRNDEARPWIARSDPASPIRLAIEGIMAARSGDRAGDDAKKARIRQLYGGAEEFNIALVDAQLDDRDAAFADLDRAWQAREGAMIYLPTNPWLDPIRSDPRYAALVRTVNFP